MWSKRGDELFFRHGESVFAVRIASAGAKAGSGASASRGAGAGVAAAPPQPSQPVALFSGDFDQRASFLPSYDVADGRFLMIRGRAPATNDARIAVLLRWDHP